MAELQHSSDVALSRFSVELHLVYGCLKLQRMHNPTHLSIRRYSQKEYPGCWHLTCCILAPTLIASQMWHYNYVHHWLQYIS